MNRPKVLMDFTSDLIEHLKGELVRAGYPIASVQRDEIPFCYFNLSHRLVSTKPRRVLRSREFQVPQALAAGLALLEMKLVNGETLQPHQSRRILKFSFNDGLLNDWGIHHFHLGDVIEPDGFVKRTEPVLFARLDESNAYLIDCRKHGAWTELECLQILHRNWHASLANYRPNLVTGEKLSDDALKALRSKNCNVALDIDGTTYQGLGGGILGDGSSFRVRWNSDYHFIRANGLQQWCELNVATLVELAVAAGRAMPEQFTLTLKLVNGDAIVSEPASGVDFNLGKF